ncbi:enoyl-CoA hydratase/isomerase family protein [Modicisalibacter xianhensis]|uniref:3-hydroxyisobutyryl-CoA hydrolase n=1 Tax=Modicisalibacter xianhensis TaxID=442341 RepID=A0A1I3A7I3_9GAMM|nr:enoyl-CoA hydratase/isomerase family protein [Halomonas xianhensis]SFH46024.1 Enoyl-CoA hydratase/carnithine racemase [Halomonas xianhensis]
MAELPIKFETLATNDERRIGVATLNAPRSLNALSLEMIDLLSDKLADWAADPEIVVVWLEGAGDKAFCAGGDVVGLYRAITGASGDDDFPARYFTAEYRLDYTLHTYPKPLIIWGNGIVMGGGLGLMAGGGHRVATETTRIAMPEITIGLYPDIGASWFLNRMPTGVGPYLALTGAQLNARDAIDLGLADRLIPHEYRNEVMKALARASFDAPEATVRMVLHDYEERARAPQGQVMLHLDAIQSLVDAASATEAVKRIVGDNRADEWLAANRQRLAAGCPLTAHLAWRMLERHRHGSLAQAFREELNLSVQCCRQGDLAEGVRALLIDKDKSPRWRHADVASVPDEDIDAFFTPLWPAQSHPLRDL